MHIGRVIGSLVAAVVYDGLESVPLLWVQPLDKHEEKSGKPMVCADSTRMAGPGELIAYESSREAALTLEPSFVPVDHAIIAIIDRIDLESPAEDPK